MALLNNRGKVYLGDTLISGLPELGDTAAQASDIASGKVLYDDNGNPVTGTVVCKANLTAVNFDNATVRVDKDGSIDLYKGVASDVLLREGSIIHAKTSASNFGKATEDQVLEGVTFTSAAGLLARGKHVCKGVELPDLGDTAAQPTDMVAGKVLYDDKGNPVTGTLYEVVEGKVAGASTDPIVRYNSDGSIYIMSKTATIDALVRAGAYLRATAPGSLFGDATDADVAKGKFFTSAAGLLVEGALKDDGELSLTGGTADFHFSTEMIPDGHGGAISTASTDISLSANANTDRIIRAGDKVCVSAKGDEFGDAKAEDVRAGKTFTSYTGLRVVGKASGGTEKTLVAKSGTTTTASFDTGLSEIVAVYISRNSVSSTGLVDATIFVLSDIVKITGCSSYSTYMKSYTNYGSTLSEGDYATIDGGTVSFVGTATGISFKDNAAHSWNVLGYE